VIIRTSAHDTPGESWGDLLMIKEFSAG